MLRENIKEGKIVMNEELSYFQIKDFNELNERKVIIFGTSNGSDIVIDMLLRNNIIEKNILFFCDNNSNLWEKEKKRNQIERKILSPNELEKYCKNHKKVIIIIATMVEKFSSEIVKQLRSYNIQNIIIFIKEMILLEKVLVSIEKSREGLDILRCCREALFEEDKANKRYWFYRELLENTDRQHQLLSLFTPTKTGSSTVYSSLPYGYPISKVHNSLWMLPEDKINYKKYVKKIIIGVREPIAQNMSLIYEMVHCIKTRERWISANPQDIFNWYVINSILDSVKRKDERQYGFESEVGYGMLIQSWFEDELESGLGINIFKYPFDKRKGYQIININECEILLYRLESMNSLEEIFGKFLEIENFKFVKTNNAKFKWYSESYQNFKKYVVMPQEYIDISYNSKYMKHFYTEEEILKFREKWEKHVDPNWSIQGE